MQTFVYCHIIVVLGRFNEHEKFHRILSTYHHIVINMYLNKLAKLIVLPSTLKDSEVCRTHRRTMKAVKGI